MPAVVNTRGMREAEADSTKLWISTAVAADEATARRSRQEEDPSVTGRNVRQRRGSSPAPQGPSPPHATLFVDAKNGFNELSRKAMLWTVRHLWVAGSRFAFNCYRHAAQLILRREDGPCEVLLSCEGVTQGDPLSMVLYGLALVPLAKFLRDHCTDTKARRQQD